MNVEETLKHLGNHWDLYSLAGEGEYSFDKAKKYLIDDLGAEQDSEFALQNIGNIINRRWTSGKPLIVTTNLDLANFKNVKEQELMFARISDRILDMCRPIHMQTVESKRVASGRHKNEILLVRIRMLILSFGMEIECRLRERNLRHILIEWILYNP